MIPIGEWLPDLPEYQNPGATTAKNVLPSGASYEQFPGLSVYSSALTARCQGAAFAKDADGNTFNFAGDATKLYRLASGTWSDVSKVGGYSINAEDRYYFTQFGNRFIVTNFADPIQSWTLGTSSVFADLSATAPQARYCAVVNNFLVVGNTFDSVDGNVPYRVRWSAIGDPTSWTVSSTTLADYNDLDSSQGWVQQVVGGEYGVVFQERAITRFDYVGSPDVFQFRQVESRRGCIAPGSVIQFSNLVAYLGQDGFYIFDGNQSQAIGTNQVNQTLFNELDLSYLTRITAAADLDKQILYWAVPVSGNNSGNPNKIYMYNYSPNATKRWSFAEVDTEHLYTSLSEGYTLDTLDSVSGSIDALLFSLDSRVWTGNNFILSAFNSDHKLANFTGTALNAVVETQEVELTQGQRSNLMLVRPVVDGSGTVTIQLGTRNLLSESVTWGNSMTANSSGDFPVRSNARYHRMRINVSGGFNHIQGVDALKFVAAGTR